jgi:hypothetical protein
MKIRNIYLSSLTSIAVLSSAATFADEGVYVPELEGGVTASVGAWIATASSSQNAPIFSNKGSNQVEALNVSPGYDVGIDASLGYIFDETANGIEVFYRNFDTNSSSEFTANNPVIPGGATVDITDNLGYELNTFDLMIHQYMNIGEHMQMRFGAGASYVELEENESGTIAPQDTAKLEDGAFIQQSSEFRGWGPRLSIDARYDFGDDIEGLGIVAGGSVAYFLGDLDSVTPEPTTDGIDFINNDLDSQAVTNLRGNVGIDYVYYFEDQDLPTLGLEVGYQVDYYADAISTSQSNRGSELTFTEPVTFSGPYVNLKGVF